MGAIKSKRTLRAETHKSLGFPWLEVLLAISVVALVLQLFPSMFWTIVWAVDVTNWSWTVIIVAHVVIISALVFIRAWQQRER